jgi:oligopeptide/dipeptide ABC transporter ATP-binding protein
MSDNLLEIEGLRVHFDTLDGPIEALHSVDLNVEQGQIMGLVGESGCGKSVTSLVTIGLATCDVDEGSVKYEGEELLFRDSKADKRLQDISGWVTVIGVLASILSFFGMILTPIPLLFRDFLFIFVFITMASWAAGFVAKGEYRRHQKFMRWVRGNEISMIFQEPMTALNPLYTVEKQISEVMREHDRLVEPETPRYARVGQALVRPVTLVIDAFSSKPQSSIATFSTIAFVLFAHLRGFADTTAAAIAAPFVFIFQGIFLIIEVAYTLAKVIIAIFGYPLVAIEIGSSSVTIPGIFGIIILIGSAYLTNTRTGFFARPRFSYGGIPAPGSHDDPLIMGTDLRLEDEPQIPHISKIDSVFLQTPLVFTTLMIVFLLLWMPLSALLAMAIITTLLALPGIIMVNYLGLDPAHRRQVIGILEDVRIPNPSAVVKMYPHELSGGMRQRVMIAMMMACEPKLLIADEPTTALDVTIQAQILKLMRDLRDEKDTAILLITHDLGVIAEMCDAVTVMYAGSVVETGSIGDILSRPRMPYSIGLLHSIPTIDEGADRRDVLPIIPGQVPDPNLHFDGCRFHPRCPFANETCITTPPPMIEVEPGHFAACHHTDSIGENVAEVQAAFDVFAAEYGLEGVD